MENYVPIIEEINKAESMMTGEQKRLSRARENELIKWCENDLTLRKETIDHWDVIFRERNKGKMSTFGEHSAGLNYEKARAEELKRSIARLKEPTHPMNFDATRIAVLAHEIEPYEPTAQEIKQAEENMTLVQ